MSIFVSIAAYRDSELVSTVLDCIAKAENPDDLRIVICWQHSAGESIPELQGDPRIEIIDFDAADSRGACWARAEVMKRYAGEDYFCQVDSHTRWTPHWDLKAKKALAATGSPRPLLTCFPPAYQPGEPLNPAARPARTVLRWFKHGLPAFAPKGITEPSALERPERARFLSACFIFADGDFVRRVPYDPELYFFGEEITLGLRAFTWGYDLFHPHEVLAYHYYIREGWPRHWWDHVGNTEVPWWKLDKRSMAHARYVLQQPRVRQFGCGPVRSAAEYETYCGINFTEMTCTDEARDGVEPRPAMRPGNALAE